MATNFDRCYRLDILLRVVILLLRTNILKFQKKEVPPITISVEGMNFDFVAMNLTGFTFYSLYNSYGHFISDDQTGKVDLNDVLFSYHAIFATLLTLTQICCFPKKNNRIHAPTVLYLAAMWVFLIVWTLLTEVTNIIWAGFEGGARW